MTPDARGRFCAHCQKSVIDFTTWSDADLYAFFSENNQSVCGRFEAQQLNRAIQLPVQKPTRLYRIAIALGLSLMFTQLPATHARPKPPLTEQNIFVPREIPQNDSTGSDSLVIKGTILDATKQPAVGAEVNIEQTGIIIGSTFTDIDGNFEIVFHHYIDQSNLQIKITYTGYMLARFPYKPAEKKRILQLERDPKAIMSTGIIIKYVPPMIDAAHPGPNTKFSNSDTNHTAH